jgi:flavodoxin
LKDNIIIYYYTNTGNTELITQTVLNKFKEAGKKCEMVNINTVTGTANIPEETDIGFFSPVYAGGTAPPFEKFIKEQVPMSKGTDAFVLSNGGSDNPGNSNAFMIKKLSGKGYNITGCGFTTTPSALAEDEEPKEGEVREDPKVTLDKAIEKAKNFAQRLLNNEKPWEYGSPTFGMKLMHGMFSFMYGFMGKKFEDMAKKNKNDLESKNE